MAAFNPVTLNSKLLKGSNLIEASAGTGKTYSIAILVLRLILEKKIPIPKILIVTYTNAAVAELQDRIRNFLSQANHYIQNISIENEDIRAIVDNAINEKGIEETKQLLKAALLFMDESAIVTIHSFCQQILNKYAFETLQIFGATLQTDISDIIQDEVNKFWRKNISVLPKEILIHIVIDDLKDKITEVVTQKISGRNLLGWQEGVEYSLDNVFTEYEVLQQKHQEAKVSLFDYYTNNKDTLRAVAKRFPASRIINKNFEDENKFFNEVLELQNKKDEKTPNFPDEFITYLKDYFDSLSKLDKSKYHITLHIYYKALSEIPKQIIARTKANNILTFNDLIYNLHKIITDKKNNQRLITQVRSDYNAVFIDEFQDTDFIQFEIFYTLFISDENTITFLIGDPKQSIYAFRGADVNTYLEAKHKVKNLYTMNVNFRSSKDMVDTANRFFLPYDGYDTFGYSDSENGISYHHVTSHSENGGLFESDNQLPAIVCKSYKNKGLITENISNLISQLLSPDYDYKILDKNGSFRKIIPSDIGVLVRNSSTGQDIKAALNALGIPAVQVNDHKILKDTVTKDCILILEAVLEPTLNLIKRALTSSIFMYSLSDISMLNEELLLDKFNQYHKIWKENSIYELFEQVKSDFQLTTKLTAINQQRKLVNYNQIMQILHQQQVRQDYTMEELIVWLKKATVDLQEMGDEYELQMESDELAVKIVTIHKSKGLEYNIVCCPDLMLSNNVKSINRSVVYKHPLRGLEFTFGDNSPNDVLNLAKEQLIQENKRLIYVAVTRAVYACFIFYSSYNIDNTSLFDFVENPEFKKFDTEINDKINYEPARYREFLDNQEITVAPPPKINTSDFYWRKLSFSGISLTKEHFQYTNTTPSNDDYDVFIFQNIGYGAYIGEVLHKALETLDFTNAQSIESAARKVIDNTIGWTPEMAPQFVQFLNHVIKSEIRFKDTNFSLQQMSMSHTIREMEFTFLVASHQVKAFLELTSQYNIGVNIPNEGIMMGFMNGFIDMLFEHQGKYYILDWKSNYLGNNIDSYNSENIELAMQVNNYHLQYLIYCVAIYKYLKDRINHFDYDLHFGGVIYMFLRGVRAGKSQSIYTHKPDKQLIESLVHLMQNT